MLPEFTYLDLFRYIGVGIVTGFSVGLGIFIASHFYTPTITKVIKYDNLDKENTKRRNQEL